MRISRCAWTVLKFIAVLLVIYVAWVVYSITKSPVSYYRLLSRNLCSNPPVETIYNTSRFTQLDDVFIAVRTRTRNQNKRLDLILRTWYNLAKEQIHFFVDGGNSQHDILPSFHNTSCTAGHNRLSLCCKTQAQLDAYMKSGKRWFCHFDDDVYVNIHQLLLMLDKHRHREHCYLGEAAGQWGRIFNGTIFSFAAGSAYCLCQTTITKLLEKMGSRSFVEMCAKVADDDVCLGYYIALYTGELLTIVPEMTSQLTSELASYNESNIKQLVTIGYYGERTVNIGGYSKRDDPTRFLSVHCLLHPHPGCPDQ